MSSSISFAENTTSHITLHNESNPLVCRAAILGTLEGVGEELLHGRVMENNATKNRRMPEVVAAADVIEHAGAPPLRDLPGIDAGASKLNQQRLGDGRVEVVYKLGPVRDVQLQDGQEARQGQADEE
jgi:hypothetical protein